jgi:hypothetical protein
LKKESSKNKKNAVYEKTKSSYEINPNNKRFDFKN